MGIAVFSAALPRGVVEIGGTKRFQIHKMYAYSTRTLLKKYKEIVKVLLEIGLS